MNVSLMFSVLAKELVNNSINSITKIHQSAFKGVLKRLSGWKFYQSQSVVMLKLTPFLGHVTASLDQECGASHSFFTTYRCSYTLHWVRKRSAFYQPMAAHLYACLCGDFSFNFKIIYWNSIRRGVVFSCEIFLNNPYFESVCHNGEPIGDLRGGSMMRWRWRWEDYFGLQIFTIQMTLVLFYSII